MENSPLRKRFQIHLSTAVIVMFVAGGLIRVNVSGRVTSVETISDSQGSSIETIHNAYGWPFKAAELDHSKFEGPNSTSLSVHARHRQTNEISPIMIIVDALVALIFLWVAKIISELWISVHGSMNDS